MANNIPKAAIVTRLSGALDKCQISQAIKNQSNPLNESIMQQLSNLISQMENNSSAAVVVQAAKNLEMTVAALPSLSRFDEWMGRDAATHDDPNVGLKVQLQKQLAPFFETVKQMSVELQANKSAMPQSAPKAEAQQPAKPQQPSRGAQVFSQGRHAVTPEALKQAATVNQSIRAGTRHLRNKQVKVQEESNQEATPPLMKR